MAQPDPTRYDVPAKPVRRACRIAQDVQPILERRCVVCHGCYDAPCQLKLGAWEGIARGASNATVYDADRLHEAPPTRLFVDAQLPSQWREKGFLPVLNERTPTPETNLAASVLYAAWRSSASIRCRRRRCCPKPFDFSLDRDADLPAHRRVRDLRSQSAAGRHALRPARARASASSRRSTRWLAAGAPYEGDRPLSPAVQRAGAAWETFLNGDSNKERLMSRYLYEHLFLGTCTSRPTPRRRAFRLVRSAHAAGPAGGR